MILYITGRPDMQKQRVVSWLSQHNFPQGMIFFSDGLVHDPLRQKAVFLRNLVQEVSGQLGPPGLSSALLPSSLNPVGPHPLPHHLPSCTWMASWQSSFAWTSEAPFTALPGGYRIPPGQMGKGRLTDLPGISEADWHPLSPDPKAYPLVSAFGYSCTRHPWHSRPRPIGS